MSKHLVLVGGGHAHLVTLANLGRFIQRGHQVTVIGPSDDHYYSGMGPGMLSGYYTPRQIRFATRQVVEKKGGNFIKAAASYVDPENQTVHTQDHRAISYDVLSFNTGSYVPATIANGPSNVIFASKPIENLLKARQRLLALSSEQLVRVAVVGGGAAAVEIAGNAWHLLNRHGRKGFQIQLFSKGCLLERFPQKVRNTGKRSLQNRSIQLYENSPVSKVTARGVELENGDRYSADLVFISTGVRPSPFISSSGLATGPQGGLRVNAHLQSTSHANIFGGGDCIYFQDQPLDKVGVYAVRQNPILFHNLMAALEGTALTKFSPGGDYLLIFNMGNGKGIFFKRGVLLKGRLAFWIKDWIDRRFMHKFKSIEK